MSFGDEKEPDDSTPNAERDRHWAAFELAQAYSGKRSVYSGETGRIEVPAEALAQLHDDLLAALDALQWCSGASDFQAGAFAGRGYDTVVRPLVLRLRERLVETGRGIEQ